MGIKKYLLLNLVFLICINTINVRANDTMPIVAFYGSVVIKKLSEKEYAELKECGFTHSLTFYNTVDEALDDMEGANKAGIKIYVHSPQILASPTSSVRRLKDAPALAGYFLADEPKMADIPKYVNMVSTISNIDSKHECYINLLPYYGDKLMKEIGAQSYTQYLQTASRINLPQISFDFYPITKNGLRENEWFYTLSEIRKESLRTGRPFWGFVLSTPHSVYPQPTMGSLRLQAYVNLAYGAQAIQYFTYKTPQDKSYDFHNAPIEANSRKSKTYNLVKEMNAELKNVAKLFFGAKITSIGHLIRIPSEALRAKAPSGIKRLKVRGNAGALLATFSNNGHKYLAIVNKDYEKSMDLEITVASGVKHISKQLAESTPKSAYTILPGDITLFRLQ